MGLFGGSKKAGNDKSAEGGAHPKFGFSSTAEDVCKGIDASALTVIVTGGNSGIGAETVRVLARSGAHVVIAARNTASAEAVRDAVLKEKPDARLSCMALDLCSLASVREFAEEFKAANLPLNVLINNAGIMFCPFKLSADGVEIQFATNHLGHFFLTSLLLDTMKGTAAESGIEGRIVNLSSVAHKTPGPYKEGIKGLDSINDKKSYDQNRAYGQSKLANILHANYLAEQFKKEGINITANSVHPGIIKTSLWRHSSTFMTIVCKLFLPWKTVEQGAATTCYVALHPDVKGVSGKYFEDCSESKPSKLATDPQLGKKLWELSEKLVDSASKKQ